MLYKMNDIERSKFKVTPRIHWFSKLLLYLINWAGWILHYFFIDSQDTLSDKLKWTDEWRHKNSQYFTFNMEKSYTFVDIQFTDERGRD